MCYRGSDKYNRKSQAQISMWCNSEEDVEQEPETDLLSQIKVAYNPPIKRK